MLDLRDLNDIKSDLHAIRSRIAQYKLDADRACNIRNLYDDPEDFIESLLNALVDAKEAFDTVVDDVELVEYQIVNVIEEAEYQEVAQAATS